MISSGLYLEKINEKIAILKNEIEQSGKIGLTNIHKHCEKFLIGLLNIVYDLRLQDLNVDVPNYPGLDAGDKGNNIAYQITSERSSAKINETLNLVERYKHYTEFNRIVIFILGQRQSSNKVNATSGFSFDVEKDIQDFNSLLMVIKSLPGDKIKAVAEYIQSELPDTLDLLKSDNQSNGLINSLIDIKQSLQSSKLDFFVHWSVEVTLYGGNFTTPKLLNHFQQETHHVFKTSMNRIFSQKLQAVTTSKEVLFHQPAYPAGTINHYLEYALQFKQNSIRFEYAQYKSYKEFNTMLNDEVMPLLLILCLAKKLFEDSPMHVNVNIDLLTNGELRFVSNNSIYSVKHSMNNFLLNPQELKFSKIIRGIDNDSLLDLMQDIVHGFVASERQFGLGQPFISMHSEEQILALNVIRQALGVQPELA